MQTMAVQFGVVVRGPAVMAGRGEQVEPAAVAAAMVRALETTEKETLEYRGWCIVYLLDDASDRSVNRAARARAHAPRALA